MGQTRSDTNRRSTRITAQVALAVAVLAVGLASCGGDSDEGQISDEDQISDVIEQAMTSADPAICDEALSAATVEEIFGSGEDGLATCRTQVGENGADYESVAIETVELDGEKALASGTAADTDGTESAVTVDVVQEDGEWRFYDVDTAE